MKIRNLVAGNVVDGEIFVGMMPHPVYVGQMLCMWWNDVEGEWAIRAADLNDDVDEPEVPTGDVLAYYRENVRVALGIPAEEPV